MPSLILTLLGPDRPGLVDSVATLVKERDGNWLESRMSHLAGHFAGIVRVEVNDASVEDLTLQLQQLPDLDIVVRRDGSGSTPEEFTTVWMELVGNDRPGIVSEITRVFADMQVNVEEFQTACTGAPNSGANLFHANAELRLPGGVSIDDLQKSLEAIAVDLMVDIKLAIDSENS